MKRTINVTVFTIALIITLGMGIMSLVANLIMSFGGSNHNILFKIAHASEEIYWEDIPRCCKECWNQDDMISGEELKDLISGIKDLYK